jgi:hypothetical protein
MVSGVRFRANLLALLSLLVGATELSKLRNVLD